MAAAATELRSVESIQELEEEKFYTEALLKELKNVLDSSPQRRDDLRTGGFELTMKQVRSLYRSLQKRVARLERRVSLLR